MEMTLGGKKIDSGVIRPSESDNLVRWRPESSGRGHVESYFMKWNLPVSESAAKEPGSAPDYTAFWLKFTILQNDDHRPAVGEVWVIAFDTTGMQHVAEKSTFTRADWELENDVFFLRFGNSVIRQGQSTGEIEGKYNAIKWKINWSPRTFGVRQLPYDWMYGSEFPRNKMATPHPDARINGWMDISGQRIEFENAPGMQGHNWGVAHPHGWQWAHANILEGTGRAIFEVVTGSVAIGSFVLPPATLIYLEYNGEPILINGLVGAFFVRSQLEGFRWTVKGSNSEYKIEATLEASPEEFVGVNYQNPDGTVMRCLNSKIACAKILFWKKEEGQWTLIDELTANRNAAFEIGKFGDSLGVPIRIP